MNGKTNASTELWSSRGLITNDDSISISGTYADPGYINLDYGVKVGYMYNRGYTYINQRRNKRWL